VDMEAFYLGKLILGNQSRGMSHPTVKHAY